MELSILLLLPGSLSSAASQTVYEVFYSMQNTKNGPNDLYYRDKNNLYFYCIYLNN
jgi:hypothetical protein